MGAERGQKILENGQYCQSACTVQIRETLISTMLLSRQHFVHPLQHTSFAQKTLLIDIRFLIILYSPAVIFILCLTSQLCLSMTKSRLDQMFSGNVKYVMCRGYHYNSTVWAKKDQYPGQVFIAHETLESKLSDPYCCAVQMRYEGAYHIWFDTAIDITLAIFNNRII